MISKETGGAYLHVVVVLLHGVEDVNTAAVAKQHAGQSKQGTDGLASGTRRRPLPARMLK